MPIVPEGGLVLVTGANGFVATGVIKVLVEHGYSVRGTVRSIEKNKWLVDHFGPKVTLVEVADMVSDGAFDEAVKGVDGIVHAATILNFSTEAEQLVLPTKKGLINILEAAAKEPSVKRVIYTSSETAVSNEELGVPYDVHKDFWNEGSSKRVWAGTVVPSVDARMDCYSAAKTETEKAGFKWVQEHTPHFTFNSVLPSFVFGPLPAVKSAGYTSTSGFLDALFKGIPAVTLTNAGHVIDLEDSGILHLAALNQPDVENERVFAVGEAFTWNKILDVFRKLYPERTFLKDIPELPAAKGTLVPELLERTNELLKRISGHGLTPLEDIMKRTTEQIIEYDGSGVQNHVMNMVQAMAAAEASDK